MCKLLKCVIYVMHKPDSECECVICVTCVALCDCDLWLEWHDPLQAASESHWGFSGDPLALPHIQTVGDPVFLHWSCTFISHIVLCRTLDNCIMACESNWVRSLLLIFYFWAWAIVLFNLKVKCVALKYKESINKPHTHTLSPSIRPSCTFI